NGQPLWQRDLPTGCAPAAWTGSGLVVVPECGSPMVRLIDGDAGTERGQWSSPVATVRPSPSLCELGRTECRLVSVRHRGWLLGADGSLTAVPQLERFAQLAGERIISPPATGVIARRLNDETPLWTWVGQGWLISADSAGVYVMTDDRTVLELSPATGHLLA